jgi:hypothetical protein
VYVLCAEWCKVCRDLLESAPEEFDFTMKWIDIERSAKWTDDLAVETFPTLAVFRNERWTYWGAAEPLWPQIARLAQIANLALEPEIAHRLDQLRAQCE